MKARFAVAVGMDSKWILPIVVLGLLLCAPSLRSGFLLDDFGQLSILEQWYPEKPDSWNHYGILGQHLDSGWWRGESDPRFWRPLSSALLRVDRALFGRWAPGYHLHSLLWLAGLIAACGLFYMQLPPRVAPLALVLFTVDEAHAFPAGWISNRHSLVAVVPALLGSWAYLRWRRDGWRPGSWLSPAAFAIAVQGSETAFAVLSYVVAFELFAGPGSARRRLLALAPLGLLAALFLVTYRALDYGASGFGLYTDPLHHPITYLYRAPGLVASLLAGGLLGVHFSTDFRLQLVLGTAALAGLVVGFARLWKDLPADRRQAVRWIAPGTAGSVLVAVTGGTIHRQMLAPMIGLAVLLAVLLEALFRTWRDDPSRSRRLTAASFLLVLVAIHGVAAPFRLVGVQLACQDLQRRLDAIVRQIPAKAEPHHAYLINAPDFFLTFYPQGIHDYYHGPGRLFWHVLSAPSSDQVLRRTGPRTLELGGEMEGPRRARGQRLDTGFGTAEILAATGPGQRVAFQLDRDLDAPGVSFLVWTGTELQEIVVPEPGESRPIPYRPGILGVP